jgi:hypothetical protein
MPFKFGLTGEMVSDRIEIPRRRQKMKAVPGKVKTGSGLHPEWRAVDSS